MPQGEEILPFEDPNHEGNSKKYHTGKICITKGCEKSAGTWWSPHWCFEHNVERIRRITAGLDDAVRRAEVSRMIDSVTKTAWDAAHRNDATIRAMVAACGGQITINTADLDRECTYRSVSSPGDGTETWRITLK